MSEFPLFTDGWLTAFADVLNRSDRYRETGARWEWPVALVLLDGTLVNGSPAPIAAWLDLFHGECRAVRLGTPDECDAPFMLTASYPTWVSIVRGELDPVRGIMTGKISLKGSLATLMFHLRAATAMVACAQEVPTSIAGGATT